MGDNLGETYHAGNMRPSHRSESVQEVLDIIQQQNHYPRHSAATQSGDVSKSRNPLPAIKGSGGTTSRQLQDALEDVQLENSRLHNDDLRKHTQRLNLNDHDHMLSSDMMKTAPSALQREGTRHQLPPLSLRCDSRSNNVHNDRSSDDFKRGTISVTHGADSQTQARPSTGYGRRLRAASDGDELVGSESKAAQVDGKSSVSHNPSKGKSCKSEQRPRSSYGSRMQPSRDQSQETVDGDSVCSSRGATNAKYDDVHTKHMLSIHGKATSSNNKHRPLRVCRSHELENDFSCNQEQEQNMSYAMSNTTFVRPKSGRGRSRKPPSPRLNRPESDFTTGIDLVRPGAPTPPSDMLEDKDDFTGDSFVAKNRTSRLMTL